MQNVLLRLQETKFTLTIDVDRKSTNIRVSSSPDLNIASVYCTGIFNTEITSSLLIEKINYCIDKIIESELERYI